MSVVRAESLIRGCVSCRTGLHNALPAALVPSNTRLSVNLKQRFSALHMWKLQDLLDFTDMRLHLELSLVHSSLNGHTYGKWEKELYWQEIVVVSILQCLNL